MTKKTLVMILGMLACLSSGAMAQKIVFVSSSNTGAGLTEGGVAVNNDQGFVNVLTAAGYTVTREVVTAASATMAVDQKARLEAADLVIMSRTNASGNYGDIAAWNGITKPILSLIPHVVRSDSPRWKWMNVTTSSDLAISNLTAVVPAHPIFAGVTLDAGNQVNVLTTAASFPTVTTAGNGTILAMRASDSNVWIVLWDKGVEFYAGSGQTAGGPRMLFCLGEKVIGSDGTRDGVYNLTAEGQKLFINAVKFLAPSDPTFNPPPSVNAGPDQVFPKPTFPLVVTMAAVVTDKDPEIGPKGTLSYAWSFVSGPAAPSFDNATSLNPKVTFTQAGEYVLKLVASDGDKSSEDTMTVYINDTTKNMLMAHWNFESLTTANKLVVDVAKGNNGVWTATEPNQLPTIVPGWITGSTQAVDFRTPAATPPVVKVPGPGQVNVTIADTDPNFVFGPRYAITLSAWVKVKAFSKDYSTVVSKGDDSWRLARQGSTNAMAMHFNGLTPGAGMPGNGPNGTISVNDDFWHHVCGTYDGEKIRLYIDGVLDVEGAYTGLINTSTYVVQISGNAQAANRQWDGILDDVRIYNYAISETDIRALTVQGRTIPFVDAGMIVSPLTYKTGDAVPLTGRVLDYGTPSAMTVLWTTVSGPGGAEAIFAGPSSPTTTVKFPAFGQYKLRLTAADDLATVIDEITVDVVRPTCADVKAAGKLLIGDFDENCRVNLADFALLAADWLRCNDPANYGPCFWPFPQ
jgi:hypothetical protein